MTVFSKKIEPIISEVQSRFQVPALSISVVGKNQIEYMKGFGTLGINQQESVDENTIFALASISKSTASAGLGILVDEGLLSWNEPVRNFLPDFSLYDPYVDGEIQVRDLLIHNSGLGSVSGGTIWYDSKFTRKQVVHNLRYLRPLTSFRSSYAYQNVNYLVAGEIIEAISGLTWDEFVNENIFEPLGMHRTTTKLTDLEKLTNYARPHAWLDGKIQQIPYRNHENVGAAAAVNSSVSDWAQYLQMFLNHGSYKDLTILSPERIKEMWSPSTIIPQEEIDPLLQKQTPILSAYGMGWFLRDYCKNLVISHSGGVDGMRTYMAIIPEKELGFLIFSNLEPGFHLSALIYSMLDTLLGLEKTPWPEIYEQLQSKYFEKQTDFMEEKRANRVLNTSPSLDLRAYTGQYFDPKVGVIEIQPFQDHLRLDFTNSYCFKANLYHWHHDTFEIVWDDSYIPKGWLSVEIDETNTPQGLKFDQKNLLDVDFSELDVIKYS